MRKREKESGVKEIERGSQLNCLLQFSGVKQARRSLSMVHQQGSSFTVGGGGNFLEIVALGRLFGDEFSNEPITMARSIVA